MTEEEFRGAVATQHVDSASDQRTANNVVRHQYKVLSDDEKAAMLDIKDRGAAFIEAVNMYAATEIAAPRSAALAVTKMQEAVMWAVHGITA